jgi:AcrR family transcriptional regulator
VFAGPAPERIQHALAALCAERGYEQLDLAGLCSRAGVGEEEFHRHFTDLDECFSLTVERGTEALLAAVGAAFLAEAGWRRQLRACAWALLDFLRADLDWARLMVSEAAGAPERAREARDRGMQALAALLDLARTELPDPSSVPPATDEVTAGAIYARIHLAVEEDGLAHGEQLVPELMYIAVRPYFGDAAARAELEEPRPG